MHDAAKGLASLGRHGDDTLLHVSQKELQGLRALTGKDFTRNPHTGLPEAFSWSSLIPIAAGVAGTALGGPLGGALASGATSAAVGAAEGKSAQQALTQGLISGITSYAGGTIMQGVGAGAGEAAGEGFGQVAAAGPSVTAPSIGSMPTEAAMASLPSTPTEFTTGISSIGPSAGAAAPAGGVPSGDIIGPVGPAQNYAAVSDVGPRPPSFGESLGQKASSAVDRASNIVSDPGRAFEQVSANVKENPYSALIAAGGTYAQAMDQLAPKPYQIRDTYDPNKYPERFPANPRRWNAPPSDYVAGYGPEYRYFAKGGLSSLRSSDNVVKNVVDEAKAALLGEHPNPKEAIGRMENMFGPEAVSLLRDRITGGRVRGAGGGMDDLVPGTIEGRQKVRLADGEFVVPADVVSGLGDGSTDQGVRRLHEMMNKVRKERTGKEAQPKAVGGKITL